LISAKTMSVTPFLTFCLSQNMNSASFKSSVRKFKDKFGNHSFYNNETKNQE
jgi:hypothetical protein